MPAYLSDSPILIVKYLNILIELHQTPTQIYATEHNNFLSVFP